MAERRYLQGRASTTGDERAFKFEQEGVPAYTVDQPPEAMEVLRTRASENKVNPSNILEVAFLMTTTGLILRGDPRSKGHSANSSRSVGVSVTCPRA